METRTVGVVGCGLMGSGVAEICAKAGLQTVVREVTEELAKKGLDRIKGSLDRAASKGKMTPEDAAAALSRLKTTTRLEDLKGCDLVVEAVIEDVGQKRELFAALDGLLPPHALIATNTSSCSVTDLMAATKRPGQVAGLHFFNPVPVMKLVEIVRTIATSDETVSTLQAFCAKVGKTAILAPDRSGFLVNRLLVPYLLDAIRAHEDGFGTVADLDTAMKLGCGYPMGPFELLDFVGLDTTLYITEIMFAEYREKRFAAPPLLRRMVAAGWLGKKSGRGFYRYDAK